MSDDDLIPASTVLLLRDAEDSIEVLMLRRNSKIAFAGMWVFPGGRVDDDELVPGDDLASARRAAVREAMEETELSINAEDLIAWNHWQPPPVQAIPTKGPPRRFRTWFFVAPAPEGLVVIDDGEIKDHAWLQPQEALRQRDAGEIEIAPPTFVTLFELSQHRRVQDAMRWASDREPERFSTRLMDAADPRVISWHGDSGYESGQADLPGPQHRLLLHTQGWEYVRRS